MRIDVLSLFPRMFSAMQESIVGKAIAQDKLTFSVTDFRDYTTNKHNNVDDYPFGGGQGMLLTPQPMFDAMAAIEAQAGDRGHVVLLDPAGRSFNHKVAKELATHDHLTFITGHYEGYDERIRELVDDEISLGDYVLTGGELGAMVVIDATVRFVPDVLGNRMSAEDDSFENGRLEHPQYTRPADFRGRQVPPVLLSGNHAKIAEWRTKESLRRTYQRRPDLLASLTLTNTEQQMLAEIVSEEQAKQSSHSESARD